MKTSPCVELPQKEKMKHMCAALMESWRGVMLTASDVANLAPLVESRVTTSRVVGIETLLKALKEFSMCFIF